MPILDPVRCLIDRTRTALSGRIVVGFLVTFLMAVWAMAPGHAAGGDATEQWVPGRVLLQPKPGIPEARLQQIIAGQGGQAVGLINAINVRIIQVPPQAEEAVVHALSRNPHIKFAEKDYLVELSHTEPNDPRYGDAWHLGRIEAPDAWSLSRGNGIMVAVLDTGVDASHPDMAGKLVAGWNSAGQNNDTSDIHGHGTRVAGTVGAATDNATGVAAVGWEAKIMPVRVTDRSDGVASSSDMARGLTWAADNGAHVANMSYESWRHSTVASAAQYMRNKGGLVFGAAGNAGTDTGNSPTPYVIVVAATNSSDSRTSWSNYGSYVDLAAPGAGILTTSRGGGYSSVSGTSFSSPVAAAVGALVMAANGQLSPSQVEQILFDSAVDLGAEGWDPYYGWGRVNAAAAVTLAWSSEVDREAPEVWVGSLAQGATVSGELLVSVEATDNIGVTEVRLHANGKLLGTESVAPYEFVWDTTAESDGTAQLYAEAYDAAGNSASHSISVTIDNTPAAEPEPIEDTIAPEVGITSPGDGETVSGNIRVEARATDNVGVVRMELRINDQLLCVEYSDSVSCRWQTRHSSPGSYTITALAADAAGNVGSSAITVQIGGSSSDDDGGGGPPPGKGKNR